MNLFVLYLFQNVTLHTYECVYIVNVVVSKVYWIYQLIRDYINIRYPEDFPNGKTNRPIDPQSKWCSPDNNLYFSLIFQIICFTNIFNQYFTNIEFRWTKSLATLCRAQHGRISIRTRISILTPVLSSGVKILVYFF